MTAWIAPAAALLAFGAGAIALNRLPPARGLAVAALAAGAGLAVLRQFALAIPLAIFGLMLLSRTTGPGTAPSPGQSSEVRTDGLAMALDHDTGRMDGEILSGAHGGRRLSELSAEELQELVAEFDAAGDEDSLSLLLAYLDRHRTDEEPRSGGEVPPGDGVISETEAYRILGLVEGADLEEVRAAHRRLIKRVHPDLGGSDALAAMINAAKERLDPD